MNRTRCGWGLGLAGLLATVCLGLPQSAHAHGKGQGNFTDGLENAIDQIVHLIGMGAQEDLPRKDVKGLDHALQQLLRVFEDGPPGLQHHGHHHHGQGLGMGARQAGGDAGNQNRPAQDQGQRGRFDQGAKCLCECMNPGAGDKRQVNKQPADPKAGQPVAGNKQPINKQPANPKAGQPVAGKKPSINQGIKMDPGMAYLMSKPHAAKQQGPTNVASPAATKNGPPSTQQPVARTAMNLGTKTAASGGTIARGVSPLTVSTHAPAAKTGGHSSVAKGNAQPCAGAGKQAAARTTNSAPMQRQSRARVGGNRQMLSSPWTVSSSHMAKR
jgi:hypothetical protein